MLADRSARPEGGADIVSREVTVMGDKALPYRLLKKIMATCTDADYGRLSVMLQWRYAMENVLFVPPGSFDPPPRVDSAVVRLKSGRLPVVFDNVIPVQLGTPTAWFPEFGCFAPIYGE